ncbi:MAG TPA: helix-turn-helix domain-containing protein [Mycobacteriales bacterium]|nr:helix-turn-helix domain-containing protein [Mycobacteriales bacterium]
MEPELSGWDRRRQQLLDEYERVALTLFADRGYHSVTIEDIAVEAHISQRTLFRYFATKEDMLLRLPRRGVVAVTSSFGDLAPRPDAVTAAWRHLRTCYRTSRPDAELAQLWRRAASGAPEVVARARGERIEAVIDAVSTYLLRSLGPGARPDVRARVYAGILAGGELAVIESFGRGDDAERIFDAAEAALRELARGV